MKKIIIILCFLLLSPIYVSADTSTPPVGVISRISGTGMLEGWVVDPDNAGQAVTIKVFIDSTSGTPQLTAIANISDQYVGPHAFSVAIPERYWDSASHTVSVKAVDLSDTTGASDTILDGSGMTFTLVLPPVQPPANNNNGGGNSSGGGGSSSSSGNNSGGSGSGGGSSSSGGGSTNSGGGGSSYTSSSGGGGNSSGGGGSSSGGSASGRNSGTSYTGSNTTIGTQNISNSNTTVFNRALSRGLKGDDVLVLQKILITQGLLTDSDQTGFFGPITENAVKQLQKKYGIISVGDPITTGYGSTGPKTRIILNGLVGGTNLAVTNVNTQNNNVTAINTIGQQVSVYMKMGAENNAVKLVQQALVKEGLLSAQYVTGYFGTLTENAVKQLQKKYGIVSSGSPSTTGYGSTGPKTRQIINLILAR